MGFWVSMGIYACLSVPMGFYGFLGIYGHLCYMDLYIYGCLWVFMSDNL